LLTVYWKIGDLCWESGKELGQPDSAYPILIAKAKKFMEYPRMATGCAIIRTRVLQTLQTIWHN